jgi:NAD(P)-dependent dehydrogenase (short-subunit alcohol dehydrogenase family)
VSDKAAQAGGGAHLGKIPFFPSAVTIDAKDIFDVAYWGMCVGVLVLFGEADVRLRSGVVLAAKCTAKGLVTESLTFTCGAVEAKPMAKFSVVAGVSGALVAMTRGLALDLAPARANCISVGLVDTEMHAVSQMLGLSLMQSAHKYGQNMPTREQIFKHAAERAPVKHVGTPEEVAEGVCAREAASTYTEQALTTALQHTCLQ